MLNEKDYGVLIEEAEKIISTYEDKAGDFQQFGSQ